MGFLDGVKGKLGFREKPQDEWADDGFGDAADDEYYDDDEYFDDEEEGFYDDEPYDDEDDYIDDEPYNDEPVSFSDYNPDKFAHIRVNTDRPLRVASYEDSGDSYFSSRSSSSSYSSNIGTTSRRSYDSSSSRSSSSAAATWGAPSDPAFLDSPSSKPDRENILGSLTASDSSASGEFRHVGDDPSAHIEIVTPIVYANVEQIATAFKAGKIVVLSLRATKPELAKRILDFSFGVACALNGTVDKAGDRVFIITKGVGLNAVESEYLRSKGLVK